MKNWLSIGQFSKRVQLTERALRLYEKSGLLQAHTRGENGYRYFTENQVELVARIKEFKSFGFSLQHIKALLEIDAAINPEVLKNILATRLEVLKVQQSQNQIAQERLLKILTSLKSSKPGLGPQERKFIMSQIEKLSVVVAGIHNLDMTAEFIRNHIASAGKNIPVILWTGNEPPPTKKPYILVVAEPLLSRPEVAGLSPDVVVIKELSTSSAEIHESYINLYGHAGPHMTTVMNADDRAVVEFAANAEVRKGRPYYFSKNSALQPQISQIGGAVVRGNVVEIYGMNQTRGVVEVKMDRVLGSVEEVSYMASLVAVMDLGLSPQGFASA